jgi:hypothetical protein
MNPVSAQPSPRDPAPRSIGVLLWCILAAVFFAVPLLVTPPEGRGLDSWSPENALRPFTDLLLFYCIFILPAWQVPPELRRLRPPQRWLVVLITGITGLYMLAGFSTLDSARTLGIAGFALMVAVAADYSAAALQPHRAAYFVLAAFVSLGLPLIGFFCNELFKVELPWLDFFSPFSAVSRLFNPQAAFWPSWIVFAAPAIVSAGVIVRRSWRHR